ncbi:MAG TPA: NUDIX hydrolase [Intrasporangium sp.]|uniref:NUDIX hydrolase n=1 Tax=Intrasporangium sp. TaxID=1925024 RepID=UPI002D76DFEE|nr:NUDIX hydrolase [Intrasporangium sp.]HET7396936.1 NUDIX hydrolase [Intrasporangium sp.]
MPSVIPAAGTLPWRRRGDLVEVALVHRPKYDDWSWAKGKLDPGELPCVAAARETEEETGLHVALGIALPSAEYPLLDAEGAPARKQVHYWAARVVGGDGRLEHEIDEVAWVDVATAHARLDYARDRQQLLALVRASRDDMLDTWPLVLVRHGKALSRSSWKRDDRRRPLNATGQAQAQTLAGVLAAYGITQLVSSDSRRCVQTFEPYAARAGVRLKARAALSEEAHEQEPAGACELVTKVLASGRATAVCSHGPVLPDLLGMMARRVDTSHPRAGWLVEELSAAADSKMGKGEALVCQVVGRGDQARVVCVERITT